MLATICADNQERPRPAYRTQRKYKYVKDPSAKYGTKTIELPSVEVLDAANGGTLVIVPVSLLAQWEVSQEIYQHLNFIVSIKVK